MNRLKYIGYSIVFQEVPDEVSLVFNISGCPHKCQGCHSEYLWNYEGSYLTDDFYTILNHYKNFITCICFMGGDQNPEDLLFCANIAKSCGYKICLYSGSDNFQEIIDKKIDLIFDYIKIGSFKQELGGLDNPKTNQKFFKKNKKDNTWVEETYKFQQMVKQDENKK